MPKLPRSRVSARIVAGLATTLLLGAVSTVAAGSTPSKSAGAAACSGTLVASQAGHVLQLQCGGGVERLTVSLNADLTSVGRARAGGRSLACALVRHGKQPADTFSCAGRAPLSGKLRVSFDVATVPACGLVAKAQSSAASRGVLRTTTIAEAATSTCGTRPSSGTGATGTPSAPTPIPTPGTTPAPSPAATPAPTTPDPSFGDRSFSIIYRGASKYGLTRYNDWGMGAFDDFDADLSLGWTTTYAPITLDAHTADGASADGVDVLTGEDYTHDQWVGADDAHSGTRNCHSTGAPTDADENPPTVTFHRLSALQFQLVLEATNVPQWPGSCDDGNSPALYPFEQDPVFSGSDLTETITIDDAQLDAPPYTVNLTSSPDEAGRNCAMPDYQLTRCTSDMKWTGSVTFTRAPSS